MDVLQPFTLDNAMATQLRKQSFFFVVSVPYIFSLLLSVFQPTYNRKPRLGVEPEPYWRIACDVMAAMLVDRNNKIFLLWELTAIFMQTM